MAAILTTHDHIQELAKSSNWWFLQSYFGRIYSITLHKNENLRDIRPDLFNGKLFEQVTAGNTQVKVIALMMAEFHFTA